MTQFIHNNVYSLIQKIVFVILLVFSVAAHSQTESFIRSIGTDGFNYGLRLAVLQDTTYMLMGNKSGYESMNNVYLIHVDQAGHIIRDKVFGGSEMYVASDMAVLGDTLFVVTGYSMNSSSQEYDVFIMWINKNLDLVMQKQFELPGWNFGKAITTDNSGNVYVACESYSFSPKLSILLLHYSSDGTFINDLLLTDPDADEIPESMIMVDDSLLFLCGSKQAEQEPKQGMITKIKTDFSKIDTLLYGSDSLNIHYSDITQVGNDRISVTGYYTLLNDNQKMLLYHSFDKDLLNNGTIWDNVQGTHCNCITSSVFKHTALGCHTTSFGSGNADFHYFRFDYNMYLDASTVGGILYDEPFDIAYALDSSLVLIGTTQSFGTPITSIMFVKTCKDYYFCVSDYEHQTHINEIQSKRQIFVFPNPACEILNIRIPAEEEFEIRTISVYSADGKLCYQTFGHSNKNPMQFDVSQFHQGFYFLCIETSDGIFQTKFIKN